MRYRSKPSEIEAIQWAGTNHHEVAKFYPAVRLSLPPTGQPGLTMLAGKDGAQDWVPVPVGHWIVRQPGDPNDHWPADPDYFAAKYEPVEDDR